MSLLEGLTALRCAQEMKTGPCQGCGMPSTKCINGYLFCDGCPKLEKWAFTSRWGEDSYDWPAAPQIRKLMAIYRSNLPL